MDSSLGDADRGKRIVSADGTVAGIVRSVDDGLAYVDPDPGVAATVLSKLGLGDPDRDTYPLDAGKIEAITDDEIRLTEPPSFAGD